MAIQTVYYRQKIAGTGWRYRPLTVGRRPEAAKNGRYFIRVRNNLWKYQWIKDDTEHATAKAAPVARQAQELSLTVDDFPRLLAFRGSVCRFRSSNSIVQRSLSFCGASSDGLA